MTEQEAKAEAQRIVEKHKKIDYSDLRYSGAKQHALLEVKSNIDLLDKGEIYIGTEWRNRKLNNLKQVKAQVELL